MIHPEDRQRFNEFIDQAMQGTTISSEFRNCSLMELLSICKFAFQKHSTKKLGKPVKMNGMTQDITERKKSRVEAATAGERYTSEKIQPRCHYFPGC